MSKVHGLIKFLRSFLIGLLVHLAWISQSPQPVIRSHSFVWMYLVINRFHDDLLIVCVCVCLHTCSSVTKLPSPRIRILLRVAFSCKREVSCHVDVTYSFEQSRCCWSCLDTAHLLQTRFYSKYKKNKKQKTKPEYKICGIINKFKTYMTMIARNNML